MNTPAHLIFGLAAFAKPGRPRLFAAAATGSLLPDVSLYLMSALAIYAFDIPARIVFDEMYFSEAWQAVFRIDNSLILWGGALLLAWRAGSGWGVALTGSAMLHIALDLPLHHDDGRAHFWPLTDWVFESPISYWDPAHGGIVVGGLEMVASLALCVLLWHRFDGRRARALVATLAAAEIAPAFIWAVALGTG